VETNGQLLGSLANGTPAGDSGPQRDPAERLGTRRKVRAKRPRSKNGGQVQHHGPGDDVPGSAAGTLPARRSVIPEGFIERARTVELDGEFASKYPGIWDCMTRQLQTNGDKRAPGELKLWADGAVFVVSLVLPEEGASMTVNCPDLTNALSALECTLWDENPPWRKASKYAVKKKLGKPKKG